MKFDLGAVLGDAWAAFKRDRDVLMALAGLFMFVPVFGLYLMVPAPPPQVAGDATQDAKLAWFQSYMDWAGGYGGWYVVASLLVYFGGLAVLTFSLDAARPDVATAMRRALETMPRYVLAMIVVGPFAFIGLALLVLPGLYVLGRTMAIGPAMIAEPPPGVRKAIGRSLALTRGHGLSLMALAAIPLIGGALLAEPILTLDTAMRVRGADNPVAIAIVDGGAALVTSASLLAMMLIQAAAYRRLVASKGI